MIGVGAATASGLAQNKWTPVVAGVLIVGIVAIVYFGVARPILCKTGVLNCRKNKRRKKLEDKVKRSDALNPNFYRASQVTMTHFAAKVAADELEDDLSGADDEEAVFGILQSAKSTNNMSLISHYFQLRHGESLADRLTYDMGSEEELDRMLEIIESY